MHYQHILGLISLSLLLTSCATTRLPTQDDTTQEPIQARVIEAISVADVNTLKPACMKLTLADSKNVQWLKIEFRRDRMRSNVLAISTEEKVVAPHTHVEVKALFCDEGKLYRVTRVLSSPAQ